MGSSHHLQISKIVGMLKYLQPLHILDVGTGHGKYGVLANEYVHSKGKRIDGIEGHSGNVTALHKAVYNQIFIGDALELIDEIDFDYDLVLLIDVLEHFSKQEGTEFITKVIQKGSGIIISTPKYVGIQESEENPYQLHKSQWSKSELSSFGDNFFVPDPISHLVYIGPKPRVEKLRSQYNKNSLRYKIGSIGFINRIYRKLFWNKDNAIDPQE